MATVELHPTRCAVCRTEGNAAERYPANLDERAFTAAVFSARRLPDRLRYRIVKCDSCGLLRSDPVADAGLIAGLYARSGFDYGGESENLKRTYGGALRLLDAFAVRKRTLLEIGCGSGFFLEEARARGYARVRGVEPSAAAVALAPPAVRSFIVNDVMRPGLFGRGEFDVICMFQVLDHISDPGALLDECLGLLSAGGMMLCITHNAAAWSARLLGCRSPIIDVEHTYLFSPATIRLLFEAHGFEVLRTGAVRNRYSLRYLSRLMPLPPGLKARLLSRLEKSRAGGIAVTVPLGNLCCIARKPPGAGDDPRNGA